MELIVSVLLFLYAGYESVLQAALELAGEGREGLVGEADFGKHLADKIRGESAEVLLHGDDEKTTEIN